MFLRRLLLVFSIVICGLLALSAAASAAGGFGPGKYTFHSTSASAFFGMGKKGGPPAPSLSVYVNQGLNSFKPTHPNGPRIVNEGTMVFVSEWDASGNGGYGCFVVPDSSFTVSRDLQSAALHAVLTSDEMCPGYGSPVGGPKGAVYAPGNGGLSLPLTVDVAWNATGAVTTFDDSFSLQCLDYTRSGSSSNESTGAGATASTSALSGQLNSEFADISSADGKLDIRGVPQSGCLYY